jgi:hypothetical protein
MFSNHRATEIIAHGGYLIGTFFVFDQASTRVHSSFLVRL